MSKQVDYKKTRAELTADILFDNLYNYWKNIAINILEYENLETASEDLTSEIIEEQLFEHGQSIFFNSLNGYLCLKANAGLGLNVYGKPTKYTAIGTNFQQLVDVKDGVLIKNNALGKPLSDMIIYYCMQLVDIEMTKNIRRNAHKTPFMLKGSEEELLSAKNIFKQIEANEPVLFKNKKKKVAEEISVEALNTDVQYMNDKLDDEYNTIVSKILTLLGIDNYVQDKMERVQSAEVEAQQEYITENLLTRLEQRQKAVDKINKKFGLSLSVKVKSKEELEKLLGIEPQEKVPETEAETAGGENG